MAHIKSIETNIKSPDGATRKWSLEKNTLLLGKNESGKSTIAEAMQLALSGAVTGLLLRPGEVKKGDDLATLIPASSSSAHVRVEFSDGSAATWAMERGKRAKQAGYSPGECPDQILLPITTLKSNLAGSGDRAIRFFFRFFGRKMTLKELGDLAAPETGGLSEEAIKALCNEEGSDFSYSPDELLSCIEAASAMKRDYRARARALEQTLAHFSGAQAVQKTDVYTAWQVLFRSLDFERLRKIYRDNAGLRSFCGEELGRLGDPEDLKELSNSVEAAAAVEAILEQKLTVELANRVRKDASEAVKLGKSFAGAEAAMVSGVRAAASELLPAYCSRVSRFLPKDETFECSISGGKFRYGLRRDNGLHRAMSGSTEVRVLAAMAAALALPSEALSVLILDDRMWDMDTLRETMCALEDSPCQVIIMSTSRPRGKPRKKWAYVDVVEDCNVDDDT